MNSFCSNLKLVLAAFSAMEGSVQVESVDVVDSVEILDCLGNVGIGKHGVLCRYWFHWAELDI